MSTSRQLRELRTGDEVSFEFGGTTFVARVVEDRGHIGVGGRQLVRIEIESPHMGDEPKQFNMPAEELELRSEAA